MSKKKKKSPALHKGFKGESHILKRLDGWRNVTPRTPKALDDSAQSLIFEDAEFATDDDIKNQEIEAKKKARKRAEKAKREEAKREAAEEAKKDGGAA